MRISDWSSDVCSSDLLAAPTAAQRVLDATASLDVRLLVSNAGFGLKGSHADNDVTAMTEMLMVNCHVPMQLARGFIPPLLARGQGGLVLPRQLAALNGSQRAEPRRAGQRRVSR